MGKNSIPWKTIKVTWNNSFQKDKMFGEDGIMNLPEKCQKWAEQNDKYVAH